MNSKTQHYEVNYRVKFKDGHTENIASEVYGATDFFGALENIFNSIKSIQGEFIKWNYFINVKEDGTKERYTCMEKKDDELDDTLVASNNNILRVQVASILNLQCSEIILSVNKLHIEVNTNILKDYDTLIINGITYEKVKK